MKHRKALALSREDFCRCRIQRAVERPQPLRKHSAHGIAAKSLVRLPKRKWLTRSPKIIARSSVFPSAWLLVRQLCLYGDNGCKFIFEEAQGKTGRVGRGETVGRIP